MPVVIVLLCLILVPMGFVACDDISMIWQSPDNLSPQAVAEVERGKTDRAEIAARMAADRREVFQQNFMICLLFGGLMFAVVILYRLEKSDQRHGEESARREAAELRMQLLEAERMLAERPRMTRIQTREGREYYLPSTTDMSLKETSM